MTKNDLFSALNILIDVQGKSGGYVVAYKRHFGIQKLKVVLNQEETLTIDFFWNINCKGFSFINDETILRNTKIHNEITVLKEGPEAAIVLLKELLMHKKLKSWGNAYERLSYCFSFDEKGFCVALGDYLPENRVNWLSEQVRQRSWAAIERNANKIRWDVVKSNYGKYGFLSIVNVFEWGFLAMKDKVKPKQGVFVAIIGPDGSGKTTLVNEVCDDLQVSEQKGLFSQTHHMASNFEILPRLSKVLSILTFKKDKNRQRRSSEGFQGHHSGMQDEPNSSLRSMLYISWYSIDLILGRWFIFRKKSQGELIFFARYFYDYYYQRGNRNAPKWFLKFFELLIPKPDLVFYIDRSPEDIYKMKPELSIDEIARQQTIIDNMALNREYFLKIDGMNGIDSSKQQIITHINKYLSRCC